MEIAGRSDRLFESSLLYCSQIAKNHYENFPISSWLVPRKYRWAIQAIYAFARTADDLADEGGDWHENRDLLHHFRKAVETGRYNGGKFQLIFPALFRAMQEYAVPSSLLTDLLDAFIYDMNHKIFLNWENMLEYCQKSAQPVGRIVLTIMGYNHPQLNELSDFITTGLQLANFWQDISVDYKQKNRIYIPQTTLQQFDLSPEDIGLAGKKNQKEKLINFLVSETRQIFFRGKPLVKFLKGRLRWEIALTIKGGMAILNKTEKWGEKVFVQRPQLSKFDYVKELVKG